MTELKMWKKTGEPTKLAGKFGKWLISQMFVNPKTNKEEEFTLFGQKDWSIVLAITKERQVLVVRQYKQGCDSIVDELAAGTAGAESETPETVMHRELREETGFVADRVIPLGFVWIATRNSPTKAHLFLALDCICVGEQDVDEGEEIEMRQVALAEWLRMVQDGRIMDPSSVTATMRALPFLGITLNGV